jgi:predicted transcriptional regulator
MSKTGQKNAAGGLPAIASYQELSRNHAGATDKMNAGPIMGRLDNVVPAMDWRYTLEESAGMKKGQVQILWETLVYLNRDKASRAAHPFAESRGVFDEKTGQLAKQGLIKISEKEGVKSYLINENAKEAIAAYNKISGALRLETRTYTDSLCEMLLTMSGGKRKLSDMTTEINVSSKITNRMIVYLKAVGLVKREDGVPAEDRKDRKYSLTMDGIGVAKEFINLKVILGLESAEEAQQIILDLENAKKALESLAKIKR